MVVKECVCRDWGVCGWRSWGCEVGGVMCWVLVLVEFEGGGWELDLV